MTHPGEPGYASASRKAHTASVAEVAADDTADGLDALEPMGLDAVYVSDGGDGDATRAPSRRRPWTLRRRLLVIVAALLVAVSAVIGIATVLVFHTSSVERLDTSLRATASRATEAAPPGFPTDPRAKIGRASCRERVL